MEQGSFVLRDYLKALSSGEPVPGGGGAASLAGAFGVSLAAMVGHLSEGKKKDAGARERIRALTAEAERLRERFLHLADEDAAAFLPLSRAYSMPRETEEQKRQRDEVMQSALSGAAGAPLRAMQCCCEAVPLLEELLHRGSALTVSDVGVGALLCRAALESAALNVYINTRLMKDTERRRSFDGQADEMQESYLPRLYDLHHAVLERVTE